MNGAETTAGGASLGSTIAFWVIAVIIIGGAVLTVTRRNSISAVMSLVATFFGTAALYTLLSAHFLAAIQVLVYAGAIMTLFVFVVMVLNREEIDRLSRRGIVGKALGVGAAAGVMLWVGSYLLGPVYTKAGLPPDDPKWGSFGGLSSVGRILFQDYLFPFEAISLLLLVAVIAAVVVARIPRRPSHPEGGVATANEAAREHAAELAAEEKHP